jgi:hypothetical protein
VNKYLSTGVLIFLFPPDVERWQTPKEFSKSVQMIDVFV